MDCFTPVAVKNFRPFSYQVPIAALLLFASTVFVSGCRSASAWRDEVDERARHSIADTRREMLGDPGEDVETAADTLRRRLLLGADLPYSGPESLGVEHLPASEYWDPAAHLRPESMTPADEDPLPGMSLDLLTALQVAARSSREYQQAKENLYRAALSLDLERDAFRRTFRAMLSGGYDYEGGDEAVQSAAGTGEAGWTRTLSSGTEITSRIAVDLVRLLTQSGSSSLGLLTDASISIPLMRGAGPMIARENLTQAQQDLVYAVYEFERFKRTFAVRVADNYLGVLLQRQRTMNMEENYRRVEASTRRARRQADAGRLPQIQVDQARQDELRSRVRLLESRQSLADRIDAFKMLLGLPADADITLESADLERLSLIVGELLEEYDEPGEAGEPPDSYAARGLPPVMEEGRATAAALEERLDLRVARGRVWDAQRRVYRAADGMRSEFTLLGSAAIGERRRSASAAELDDARLDPDRGTFGALLTFDPAINRTAEAIAYRQSLLDLQRRVRDLQQKEDEIKAEVRSVLRAVREAAEAIRIQAQAVELAEQRVSSTDLYLQAGRAEIRDVLESQEALLSAQNALAGAVVDFHLAQWRLQRDMGTLAVDTEKSWLPGGFTLEEQEQ